MSALPADLPQVLRERLGADQVLCDPQSLLSYGQDWTRAWTPNPCAIVLPRSVEDVVTLVRLANELGFALVPSGGRTGLSGGAVAARGEVVVALDRMNSILAYDPVDRLVTCQAGVVTAQLQEFAEQQGLFYPVDFASAGSSQIGGNVSTNAGGIKVIRYGMTRNWVQGMTVVTGRGELLRLNRGLVKNATGYDFRHLFIGAEGTLGVVVEVTVALASAPRDPTVMLLAVPDLEATMEVLKSFQQKMTLNAFEFFSERALGHVIRDKQLSRPLGTVCPYYALLEFENDGHGSLDMAMSLFESCLEAGWVEDGVLSQDGGQVEELWRYREDISETISRFTPYKNDISVRVSGVPAFLREVEALVNSQYPDFEIIWFGHIGDGNVHLNILKPADLDKDSFFQRCGQVSEQVFAIVERFGGSVSAEHGVGLLKKPYLGFSRSAAEIAYMKAVKKVFDPNNVMNPGKVFDI
jgi:FAD/FMN-containing dehydrogenase